MSKTLFTIICFFALLSSSFARQAPSNGQLTLNFVPGAGYLVNVDLSPTISANMVVSLSSSVSTLTENCFQFNQYLCHQFAQCQRDNVRTAQANYVIFSAQGRPLLTQIILDYANWQINRNVEVVHATTCSAPVTERVGAGASGVLGLGVDGLASTNFNSLVQGFSVFFSQAFRLQFNPPLGFNKNLIAKVRTDNNWRIPNVQAVSLGTLRNPLTGVSAILNINSDAIGLPTALFSSFTQALARFTVTCPPSVITQPMCLYAGQLAALPTITLSVDLANIVITPQMYALNLANGQFRLNIKSISPQLTGTNYVTPEYANTIILGNTVLGNYYTYFSILEKSITFFQVLP